MKKISKKQLDRYGNCLRVECRTSTKHREAINNISDWRALHNKPLASLGNSLRQRLKKLTKSSEYKLNPKYIISRRLKRMPSIEAKLLRFEKMRLSRMQDIGGLRVILKDMRNLRVFLGDLNYYRGKSKSFHIIDERNYINPTDERDLKKDGYKSFHQVYKYTNSDRSAIDLFVELQIRTELQHAWATTVETLGLIKRTAFKSGKGEEDFKEFLRLCSILFAHEEGTYILEEYKKFSIVQLCQKLKDLDNKLKCLDHLKAFNAVNKRIRRDKEYYILRLNLSDRVVSIFSYSKNQFHLAQQDYLNLESQVQTENLNWEVVLVSLSDVDKLKKGYPNYFLDTKTFTTVMDKILDKHLQVNFSKNPAPTDQAHY